MRPLLTIVALLLLALGAVEGIARWWMRPAPAGLGEPVLVYRPVGRDLARSAHLSEKELPEKSQSPARELTTDNRQQTTDHSPTSTLTPLPEIVSAALPSLRCTTGTAARIDRDDDVTLHVAFFEWDLASSTNVLEAFKHLPEQCMGSIGLTLIEKASPRSYTVGLDRRAGPLVANGVESESRSQRSGNRRQETGVGGQLPVKELSEKSQSLAPELTSDNRPPTTDNSSSPSDNRQPTTDNSSSSTLSFDHTIFRDSRGVIVHAFKGTWVSGANTLLGDGVRGGAEQWNQLRWKAALKRFRPAHARVAQGAVRGIRDPDLAWQAFEEAMLQDLSLALPER